MSAHYIPLVGLRFFHSWYAGGVLRDFSVQPNAATTRLMKQFQLISRSNGNAFGLYCLANKPRLLKSLRAAMNRQPLVLELHAQAAGFYAFTELPMHYRGPLVFDSRQTSGPSSAPVLMLQTPTAPPPESSTAVISLWDDALFDAGGAPRNREYRIELEARKTQWRYYVVNRSRTRLANSAVQSSNGLVFDTPVPQELPTGEQALMYSSGANLLAYAERPQNHFNLVINNAPEKQAKHAAATGSRILLAGLPIPSFTQLNSMLTQGDQAACSAVYLYV